MATLGVFEGCYVAAMRGVKVESAANSRRAVKPRASRRDESAVAVLSTPSNDFDSNERCTIGDSLCSRQHPPLVESLVQSFVIGTGYVPQTATRVLESSDLPPVLERIAMQAQRCLGTWFAWTDGQKMRFIVTETVTAPRHNMEWALRMFFYDEDGRLAACGSWALYPGAAGSFVSDR
jgi:hypothetical protein